MSQWWPEPWCDPAAEEEARELAARDADAELAEMNAAADALYAAEARGACVHWSLQGRACTGCGRRFASDEEWMAAQQAIIEGDD